MRVPAAILTNPRPAENYGAGSCKLPRDLWSDVLRFLGPRESVKVACLDKFCRDLVYRSEDLWRRHCLSRWPDCQSGLQLQPAVSTPSAGPHVDSARHGGGNGSSGGGEEGGDGSCPAVTSWRQLYGDLAAAATFRLAFEDAAAATEEARARGEGQHTPTIERFAQAVHALGLAACAYSSVRCCRAYRRHVGEELAWWLAERPQVLVRFVRSLHVGLLDSQLRGSSTLARMWSGTYCWQRSAVQFLLEARLSQPCHHHQDHEVAAAAALAAPGGAGQSAALQRLLRECEALDATIRRLHQEMPAAMSLGLGLATTGCSISDMEANAAAAAAAAAALPIGVAPLAGSGASEVSAQGSESWQRGLCFDDVEEEAWREGNHAERSAGRGGLLTWRRIVEPRRHWWAWLPC